MVAFSFAQNPEMGENIMSETDATAGAETADTTTATGAIQLPEDHPLVRSLASLRTETKQLKSQASAGNEAIRRLAEIEESQKTAEQKAADKVTEAEHRATTAELKALRYEVGVEKNVPPKLLRYLTGATKEELEANAAQLIADFGAETDPGTGAVTSGRPREALRAGASAETTDSNGNQAINDRIRQTARR